MGVKSVQMLRVQSRIPDRAEQAIIDIKSISQDTKNELLMAISRKYGN